MILRFLDRIGIVDIVGWGGTKGVIRPNHNTWPNQLRCWWWGRLVEMDTVSWGWNSWPSGNVAVSKKKCYTLPIVGFFWGWVSFFVGGIGIYSGYWGYWFNVLIGCKKRCLPKDRGASKQVDLAEEVQRTLEPCGGTQTVCLTKLNKTRIVLFRIIL